jgi:hypothetical protein
MREVTGGVDLCGRRTVGLTAADSPAAIHLHAGRHRVRPAHQQRLTVYIARAASRRRVLVFTNILGVRYKVFWKKSSTKIISSINHWEKGNYDSSSGDYLRNSQTSRGCDLELPFFCQLFKSRDSVPLSGEKHMAEK